jgi:NADPH:quinone reductase-like Zn-dependent oxidoreductase
MRRTAGIGVRAVVYDRYGLPDVLRVEDVPMPSPAAGQVRVKVAATSVNLSDWEGLRGSPAYARIGGLRRPAHRILGSDIAGVVEEVGEGVTRFRPGDEVYGDNLAMMGGFAEYAVASEAAMAHKPAGLTFAEASTIPQAGAIALRGTQRAVAGCRVLINGAGGGSGTFAIQLAKRLGAHVTGVDNAAKQEFMRSVGADDVVDYHRDDFTRTARRYDLVLDLVAHRSVFAYRRALAPGGTYRCVGGSVPAVLRVVTLGWAVSKVTGRSMGVLVVKEGPAHFKPLADLCVTGDVTIHIDRTFGLEEVPAALAHVGEGRALSKVVVIPS